MVSAQAEGLIEGPPSQRRCYAKSRRQGLSGGDVLSSLLQQLPGSCWVPAGSIFSGSHPSSWRPSSAWRHAPAWSCRSWCCEPFSFPRPVMSFPAYMSPSPSMPWMVQEAAPPRLFRSSVLKEDMGVIHPSSDARCWWLAWVGQQNDSCRPGCRLQSLGEKLIARGAIMMMDCLALSAMSIRPARGK